MSGLALPKEFSPVARIVKSYGAGGGLLLRVYNSWPENLDEGDWTFVHVDGLPVPFSIQSIEWKDSSKAVAVFRPYNSRLAEELAGKELLVDSSCFECAGDAATGMDVLVGFTVYDRDMRVIGPVAGFLDYPGNPCIEVEAANGRVVLPFAEQLVLSIDEESRIICLEIPDGLL